MAQKVVATSDPDNLKACFAESRNKLLAGEAGQFTHAATVTR
jgi:hypothetical protein